VVTSVWKTLAAAAKADPERYAWIIASVRMRSRERGCMHAPYTHVDILHLEAIKESLDCQVVVKWSLIIPMCIFKWKSIQLDVSFWMNLVKLWTKLLSLYRWYKVMHMELWMHIMKVGFILRRDFICNVVIFVHFRCLLLKKK